MKPSHLTGIWIAREKGADLESLRRAELEVDRGIVGDRYHAGVGSFSRWPGSGRAVTLIAEETIRAVREGFGIDLGGGRSRRNLVTEGVDLMGLLGRRFRIGTAVLRGSRKCEPCRYLERLLGHGTFEALRGRGGIRADVVESGVITVGDRLCPVGDRSRLP